MIYFLHHTITPYRITYQIIQKTYTDRIFARYFSFSLPVLFLEAICKSECEQLSSVQLGASGHDKELGARGNFGWVFLCQYLSAWVSLPEEVMPSVTKPALALSFLLRRSLAFISLSTEAEGGRSESVSCPGLCWKHLAHLVCIPRGERDVEL